MPVLFFFFCLPSRPRKEKNKEQESNEQERAGRDEASASLQSRGRTGEKVKSIVSGQDNARIHPQPPSSRPFLSATVTVLNDRDLTDLWSGEH